MRTEKYTCKNIIIIISAKQTAVSPAVRFRPTNISVRFVCMRTNICEARFAAFFTKLNQSVCAALDLLSCSRLWLCFPRTNYFRNKSSLGHIKLEEHSRAATKIIWRNHKESTGIHLLQCARAAQHDFSMWVMNECCDTVSTHVYYCYLNETRLIFVLYMNNTYLLKKERKKYEKSVSTFGSLAADFARSEQQQNGSCAWKIRAMPTARSILINSILMHTHLFAVVYIFHRPHNRCERRTRERKKNNNLNTQKQRQWPRQQQQQQRRHPAPTNVNGNGFVCWSLVALASSVALVRAINTNRQLRTRVNNHNVRGISCNSRFTKSKRHVAGCCWLAGSRQIWNFIKNRPPCARSTVRANDYRKEEKLWAIKLRLVCFGFCSSLGYPRSPRAFSRWRMRIWIFI